MYKHNTAIPSFLTPTPLGTDCPTTSCVASPALPLARPLLSLLPPAVPRLRLPAAPRHPSCSRECCESRVNAPVLCTRPLTMIEHGSNGNGLPSLLADCRACSRHYTQRLRPRTYDLRMTREVAWAVGTLLLTPMGTP